MPISEMSQKQQTLRPQREHLKTPIPQAGNYSLAEKCGEALLYESRQTQIDKHRQTQANRVRDRDRDRDRHSDRDRDRNRLPDQDRH